MENEGLLNKFLDVEFPALVKKYFEEFSILYPERYQSIGSVEINNGQESVNLFDYLEDWFKKEYEIPFNIRSHFQFHSDNVFFTPTKSFGFDSKVKNNEEFFRLEAEYQKINSGNTPFSIYNLNFSSKSICSSIIREKLNEEIEIRFKLYELNLKSYFKRFFIQGGCDFSWITVDQLNFHGIDKFPHSLNEEIKKIEYSIEFNLKIAPLGQYYDENMEYVKDQDVIRKKENKYFKSLKKKGYKNINYVDILSQPTYLKLFNQTNKDTIFSNCNQIGKVPIIKLNQHFIRRLKGTEAEKQSWKIKYKPPFELALNFKLEPSDIIKDEKKLSEYLLTYNEPEDEIRMMLGLPKIGEGWISETFLFYQIKNYFVNQLVIQHGRPKWLNKQHLDIYFPFCNIGIEYQGDQHFYPIEIFGGEKSFKQNKARDFIKKKLCAENNCYLIEVTPNYAIENVIDQISERIKILK